MVSLISSTTKTLLSIAAVVAVLALIELVCSPYLIQEIQISSPPINTRGYDVVRQTSTKVIENWAQDAKDAEYVLQKRMYSNIYSSSNSFITERYHKYYPINCSAVFAGDNATITSAKLLLNNLRDEEGRLPVPSDDEVIHWVDNCMEFTDKRGYPLQPLSKEEADYPIAYSMVVYTHSAQVERQLRAIYQPQNVYCIHIDKSSPATFHQAIQKLASCFDNVFVASKLEDVKWGKFSAVLADLNCMSDLLNHSIQWKYVLNLCGMDFPLKTNLETVRQLKAYNNHNCVEGSSERRRILPSRFRRTKGPAPHNITVNKGDTYIAATREFVNFLVNHKVSKDFLEWLKAVRIPDEYFTNSLNRLPYAPGGNLNPTCNVRYRHWTWTKKTASSCIGQIRHGLCVFASGYLKHFYRSPKLFVNKFKYDFDQISIQCMEELLYYRTIHPKEFDQWVNFPVTNFPWH